MRQWIFDLFGFFFPLYCPVCGFPLSRPGMVMCFSCELNMPYTHDISIQDNRVAQLFWGKIFLEGATSLVRFDKGSKYQHLLHLLKYNGQKKIGEFLGRKLGEKLLNTQISHIDYIIPVPLHPKREKARGYNQSEIIAQGVSSVTGIPVVTGLLLRKENTESQTSMNRLERWKNMEKVFMLQGNPDNYKDCLLLLIDDVVTTGATLESCGLELLKINNVRLLVATVACA